MIKLRVECKLKGTGQLPQRHLLLRVIRHERVDPPLHIITNPIVIRVDPIDVLFSGLPRIGRKSWREVESLVDVKNRRFHSMRVPHILNERTRRGGDPRRIEDERKTQKPQDDSPHGESLHGVKGCHNPSKGSRIVHRVRAVMDIDMIAPYPLEACDILHRLGHHQSTENHLQACAAGF